MTRLDGEKKSPLPWIIGLIVLALLAAAIYYFTAAKGTDAVVVNGNGVELQNTAPGGLGESNAADANTTDANAMDSNAMDSNAMDANSAMMNNSAMTDSNSAMSNGSAMSDSNSAMMDNSAMSNSSNAMSNGAMSDNSMSSNSMSNSSMSNSSMSSGSMSNSASPAMTPASTGAKAPGNGVIATRSKTIKTDKATVTYKKSVNADGTLMHDKTIVPKPVEQAKKMQ